MNKEKLIKIGKKLDPVSMWTIFLGFAVYLVGGILNHLGNNQGLLIREIGFFAEMFGAFLCTIGVVLEKISGNNRFNQTMRILLAVLIFGVIVGEVFYVINGFSWNFISSLLFFGSFGLGILLFIVWAIDRKSVV